MEETQQLEDLTPLTPQASFVLFPFKEKWVYSLILFIVGFTYYINTVNNETAFDDGISLHQNAYVLRGVSGIPDIFTKDSYHSFYEHMNATDELVGGRYRPLSIMTFAIEQEIIGTYRTGWYMRSIDLNQNGVMDWDPIKYLDNYGRWHEDYEYNDFVDLNNDGLAQINECYSCWDYNKNFRNDFNEDLNKDGIYNEVDCQVFHMGFRHFNNVWLYLVASLLLFSLLYKHVLKNSPDMAFLASLLFLIHPLNTESVAGLVRRDEILSLLFILACLMSSFNFLERKENRSLIWSGIWFLCALLSKEYGFMLLLILPLGAYVLKKVEVIDLKKLLWPFALFFFCALLLFSAELVFPKIPFMLYFCLGLGLIFFYALILITILKDQFLEKTLGTLMMVIFGSFLLYIVMRLGAVNLTGSGTVDTEILNDPYVFATTEERICTKITVLFYYIKLLFYPDVLVCEHSYNSIPLKHFTDWEFILSLLVHIALVFFMIKYIIRRHIIGFGLLFYFGFLFVVSNLVMKTGGLMLEHFVFHSTPGFAIVISWFVVTGLQKIGETKLISKIALCVSLLVLISVFGYKVIERNKDWSNDVTLFLKDVDNAPNSVICLANAGARWIDLADTREITGVNITGQDPDKFNDYNGTLHITDEDLKKGGYKTKREAAIYKGIGYLERTIKLHPKFVNGYLNLGLAQFKLDNYEKAIYYWKIAEYYYPKNPYLANYYQVTFNRLRELGDKNFNDEEYQKAIDYYKLALVREWKDLEILNGIGSCYLHMGDIPSAKKMFNKVLLLDPNNKIANDVLEDLNKKH